MTNDEFYNCMLRMKAGDKEGLKVIYEEYLKYIYTIIYGVMQNKEDAEDVTSDFFIKLWDMAPNYTKKGDSHKGFLATIARNMSIDALRKLNRALPTDEIEEDADLLNKNNEKTPEEIVTENIMLKEALERLSDAERTVVSLKILSEMTFKEISEFTKTPMGTVTWRYNSAIEKLRRWGYE